MIISKNIKTLTSSCLECSGRYKKEKKIELFDGFGEQQQCIKDLSLYKEHSKLATAALNCNTFLSYSKSLCLWGLQSWELPFRCSPCDMQHLSSLCDSNIQWPLVACSIGDMFIEPQLRQQ